VLEVHAGSQSIPEEARLWAVRVRDRGGRPAFAILGRGESPLQQQTLSTAVLSPDRGPYGLKLSVSIPPIPTLVYEPDASIVSFSLTVGAAGAVVLPARCPSGGFPFAAALGFADSTSTSVSVRLPCR
jgi:hypothetical protein